MARDRVKLPGALTLVTGAGRGIGRATALALAGRGARVLAVDIDGDAAGKTAADCEETGAPEAHGFVADVADATAVEALAAEVHDRWHALDVLVNNAGVGMTGGLAGMSVDDWRWIRGINLDGVVHGCHAFGPAMVERGRGHVVNVASGLGFVPRAPEIAYCTTKAAVLMFSQCLRADWRRHGVGVTAICPGLIDTPIVAATRFVGDQDDPAARDRTARLFRTLGHRPEHVARAVLRAVRRDRVMVAVGWESKLGWWVHRGAPLAVQQRAARQAV
jgi:NAD(P)-dependent dehydrogenase (short-subunit alcohol dehydrogenase family)